MQYIHFFIFAIFETLKLLEEKKTLEEDESSPYSWECLAKTFYIYLKVW